MIARLLEVCEPPLRFFLITSFLAMSTLFASLRVRAEAGYPWPGYMRYELPGLMALFLGFTWVAGLVTASILSRPRNLGTVLHFALEGLAASAIFLAFTPEDGLPRLGVLLLLGLFVTNTFMAESRFRLLRGCIFLVFMLILVKFVCIPWVASQGGSLKQMAQGMLWLATLGGTDAVPSGAEHILLFLALLLFAASVALQWPSQSVWMHVETHGALSLSPGQVERDEISRALMTLARASGRLEGPGEQRLLGPGDEHP